MTQSATGVVLFRKQQEAIIEFHNYAYQMLSTQWNLRAKMKEIDVLYMRETNKLKEHQRAKAANKLGDQSRIQDITIPIVLQQVESAVVYQTSVFLTGSPMFNVVSSPQYEDQAVQLSAILEENSARGGWVRHFMMHFRDGFKYNFAALEITWDTQNVTSLETDVTFGGGKQGRPKDIIWQGNCIRRLDPYNTIFDLRVPVTEVYSRGEFAGDTRLMSKIELKMFLANLPDRIVDNVKAAFEAPFGGGATGNMNVNSYYIPSLNPGALIDNTGTAGVNPNWLTWAGLDRQSGNISFKGMYEVTTLYGRIVPADFGIRTPGASQVQIWKFIIVNHSVVVYCERQTNAHNFLPVLFSQPNEDGLGFQTKSLATNVESMQSLSSALTNSVIAARRRAISDRGLYDPSRVSEANINSANPSAKIPVRANAYGKPLNEAYYAIPFRDDNSTEILQQIPLIDQWANKISGQNPVRQGQFVKGNKTQSEFQDVMAHANGRDQMTSLLYEAQLFTPLKIILKTNILQYQPSGVVYSPSKAQEVTIDPLALRKAIIEFKVSDGLTPTDKLINSDVMMVAMQQIGSSPQIGAGYNIAPLFSYLMKTQGAHLKDFEKSPQQIAYEQAMQQWQQAVIQIAKDNPSVKPEQYPPQPVPQQFQYTPAGNSISAPAATA